jgi:hypothetical protein
MFYVFKSDMSVRKAIRFMACGVTVSYGLNFNSLPHVTCCASKHNAAISNPFMAGFPSKYPSIGPLLCIPNVAHGNIHVRIVIPNVPPLPYHKLQARGLADTAIVGVLLQCCHSEW